MPYLRRDGQHAPRRSECAVMPHLRRGRSSCAGRRAALVSPAGGVNRCSRDPAVDVDGSSAGRPDRCQIRRPQATPSSTAWSTGCRATRRAAASVACARRMLSANTVSELQHGICAMPASRSLRAIGAARDGELDLIALEGEVLVFCEVKTRSSSLFGEPVEAVGLPRPAMRHACPALARRATPHGEAAFWPELRFDVVSVLRQPRGAAEVTHMRAAF